MCHSSEAPWEYSSHHGTSIVDSCSSQPPRLTPLAWKVRQSMYLGVGFGLGLTGELVTVLRVARRVVRVRAHMVAVVPRDVELEHLRKVVLGKQGLYTF